MSALTAFGSKASQYLAKNSPAILMGLSIAGIITTTYLTHKAAQKALVTIQENTAVNGEPTPREKLDMSWKFYIPPVLSCGATLAFVIAGNSVHAKRQAALITAVTLGETAISEYREKMVETLGKNKERKARDEIVQKKVSLAEADGKFDGLVLRADSQDQYVWDVFSGRTLVSSIEKLNKAANEVARDCINHDYVTLNQFYTAIGLETIPVGETLGWTNTDPLEVDLTSAVVRDGKGLIAIDFVNQPTASFRDVWR